MPKGNNKKNNKKEAKRLTVGDNTTKGKTLAFETKVLLTVNGKATPKHVLNFEVLVSQFVTDKNRVTISF